MAAGLTFGSVDLMGNLGLTLHALGTDSGTSWGNATPITEQLQTFLQYGSIVVNNGWETREATVVVQVRGNTAMMNAAESALFAEVGKPNKLTYTPPGSGAAATVFRVIYSSFENTPDDLREVLSGMRTYTIRLTCEPFAYSAVLTTVAALAASGNTTTSVDTGSSTTGWTAAVDNAAVSPTAVVGPPTTVTATSASALSGDATILMTRAGTITTSVLKTLIVDWKSGAGVTCGPLSAVGNGATLTRIADTASPTAGFTRSWFSVTAASITTLQLLLTSTAPDGNTPVVRSLSIDLIAVTDARPGSAKQQARTLAIGGAAPTTGSLAVQHSSTGLGDVSVYTCPDDGSAYSPPCRPYFGTAGTADAAAASGFYTAVVGGAANLVATVPVAAVPAGEYVVMLSARSITSASTLGVTVSTAAPFGTLVTAPVMTTVVAATAGYVLSTLGVLRLPQADVASTGTVVLSIQNTTGGVTCRVDDVYLFNVSSGQLTQVACGAATRLWIDSPSLENAGFGRYLLGTLADRSDAYSAYPFMSAEGIHEFPGGKSLKVFTATTTPTPTTAADVSFAYYQAWPNHAAA